MVGVQCSLRTHHKPSKLQVDILMMLDIPYSSRIQDNVAPPQLRRCEKVEIDYG